MLSFTQTNSALLQQKRSACGPMMGSQRVALSSSAVSAPQMKMSLKMLQRQVGGQARGLAPLRAVAEVEKPEISSNPMNIVFVAAEVSPWSKTGGLGDVIGGLPIELAKRGHSVISIAPRYDQYADGWDTSITATIDGEEVRYFHAFKKGVHRVFIDHPWFLAKVWGKTGAKLYGSKSGSDFVDNHKRFALFCKSAIEAVKVLPFGGGEKTVFVANDWHSALVPIMIKDVYQAKGQFKEAKVALCIHNIAFQGRMWDKTFSELGLPESSKEKFSFTDGYSKLYTEVDPMDEDVPEKEVPGVVYKKINWLKAAILSCDKVLTVSPNYASEISADSAGGVELDEYLREAGGVEGIVNGMDVEEWNPMTDKFLDVNYNKLSVYAGKAAAKEALQAELGLPIDPKVPLFAFIGRLEEQKGVDIMLASLKLLAGAPVQVAILGTGKAKLEAALKALSKLSPNFAGVVKFSAPLAHMLTAGADYMLVPSRFEPCGLIQLHAMQYGTPPLVSSTGGLVDTVKEGITGFHMGAFDPEELLISDAEAIATTVKRAAQAYATPAWKDMVAACISQDLSWGKPAKKWEGILEDLMAGKTYKASSVTSAVVSPAGSKAASVLTPFEEPMNAAKVQAVRMAPTATLPKGPVRAAGSIVSAGVEAATTTAAAPKTATPAAAPKTTATTVPATPSATGASVFPVAKATKTEKPTATVKATATKN
jgi:granule-bound starch synthase